MFGLAGALWGLGIFAALMISLFGVLPAISHGQAKRRGW